MLPSPCDLVSLLVISAIEVLCCRPWLVSLCRYSNIFFGSATNRGYAAMAQHIYQVMNGI